MILGSEWGVSADVWSVTSWTELRRDGLAALEHNFLHPDEEPRTPYVTASWPTRPGRSWPRPTTSPMCRTRSGSSCPNPFATLGADDHGFSDTRAAARRYFHIDTHSMVVRALQMLAEAGEVDAGGAAAGRGEVPAARRHAPAPPATRAGSRSSRFPSTGPDKVRSSETIPRIIVRNCLFARMEVRPLAENVQVVDRVFDLLEAMADAGGSITLSELAARSNLPMPTIHRLIRSLVSRGYARQEPSKRYAVGPRMIRLGEAATRLLGSWATPTLGALVEEFGETTNMAMLDGDRVVYVAQVPSPRFMRMFTEVGRYVLPHCTGVGKAIMSTMEDAEVVELLAPHRDAGPDRADNHRPTADG